MRFLSIKHYIRRAKCRTIFRVCIYDEPDMQDTAGEAGSNS